MCLVGLSGSALAQKAPGRADGLYDFKTAPHTGQLAVKTIKGGLVFDLTTVSPKGATCAASGRAIGGSHLTFRVSETGADKEAGFRLRIDRDRQQIIVSGLMARVSETPFCGLGAMLTGVYKRRGPLDPATAATLTALERAAAKAP